MIRILFSLLFFLQVVGLSAQKIEQGFNYAFKPTEYASRYYVITEQEDSLWHRKAYYLPERGMAMEGWYKDKDCNNAHGKVSWYHPNKILKSTGNYINGKKEGIWLEYDEKGMLEDSAAYVAGRLKGVKLHWYRDGMPSDSMHFDGAGNGIEVSWYEDGSPYAAGKWISDTSKDGRWQYFHRNGKIKAIEEYTGGKRISCKCFDEKGKQLDTLACEEQEAEFPGGINNWLNFVSKNLKSDVPVRKNAPYGQYTVVVQFIIDFDGSISDIRPLTKFGYGMEEEVERMLKKAPRWIPARQFGTKVKAYRKQPITFVVSKE